MNKGQPPKRPLYRPSEFILWAIVLVVALYLGWRGRNQASALEANVYHEDQLVFSLDLETALEGTHELEDFPGFILETNGQGAIRIQQSPCPDKLCMRAGYLEHPGEQAICLPLELVLQLQGSEEDSDTSEGFDAVIGAGEEVVESGDEFTHDANEEHSHEEHSHEEHSHDDHSHDIDTSPEDSSSEQEARE